MLAVGATSLAASPAQRPADRGSEVAARDCRGVFAFPPADARTVRAVSGMSSEWVLPTDDNGRATLAVVTISCRERDGEDGQGPMIYATLSAFVEPPARLAARSIQ